MPLAAHLFSIHLQQNDPHKTASIFYKGALQQIIHNHLEEGGFQGI